MPMIGAKLGLSGGIWPLIAAINGDMGTFRLLAIGMFLAVWAASAAIYRWNSYDALPQLSAPRGSDRGR
ncbi:MAG TPA: hypothetical protein VLI93_17225 [Acetobacteraceae bacterium]|nr:hypothetical protein [Acetobacteraceae bacterium]